MNPWTQHLPETHDQELVLITDASMTGWGEILFDEGVGEVVHTQAQWQEHVSPAMINELELRAVSFALDDFSDRIRSTQPMLILLDNTSAMYALHKGASHAYRLNREALRVIASVTVGYIESRGLTSLPSQLPSDLRALGRRFAGSAVPVTVPSFLAFPQCKSNSEVDGVSLQEERESEH